MAKTFTLVLIGVLVLSIGAVAYSSFSNLFEGVQSSPLPATTTVYAYGPSGLLSKQVGGEVAYYHTDYLSSSALTTDSGGERVYYSDYEPFGDSLHVSGEERYTYTGKELDSSTGLYYYGARYYDASIGRFVSVDPIQGSLYSGQRLNRYTYVLNNPMVYTDPSGMESASAIFLPEDRYHESETIFRSECGFAGCEDILGVLHTRELALQLQESGSVVDVILLQQEGIDDLVDVLEEGVGSIYRSVQILQREEFERASRNFHPYETMAFLGHGSYYDYGGPTEKISTVLAGLGAITLDFERGTREYHRYGFDEIRTFDVVTPPGDVCVEMWNCALAQMRFGSVWSDQTTWAIEERGNSPYDERPYNFVADLFRNAPIDQYDYSVSVEGDTLRMRDTSIYGSY